jgi:hypothetical protein
MSRKSRSLGWLALSAIALVCCASPRPAASQPLRAAAAGYELEVLVNGVPARTFDYAGESYVLGREGSRYVLRVHNHTGRRVEAVVSVDGLDVVDGRAGDYKQKRGYLVDAYDHVDIDGWRLSQREAAVFRFAPTGESYAAKTGSARNVGVIGVAVFPERVVPRPQPRYVPEQYEPPAARSGGVGGLEGLSADGVPAAPAAAAPAPARSAEAKAKTERRERSGLGTEFGEAVSSEIQQVQFVRAERSRPAALLGVRYNDRRGLLALGIDVDGNGDTSDLALRQSASPFPAQQRFARPPADWRRD